MIFGYLKALTEYGLSKKLITEDDRYVIQNALIDLLRLPAWKEPEQPADDIPPIDDLLADIADYAVKQGVIEDTAAVRDLFTTRIMGIFTDTPRAVIAKFASCYEISPVLATDNYFAYNKAINYVRAGLIGKNITWKHDCEYGTLDITINLSKPEKDPRDIAAAKDLPQTNYPRCMLCIENAGFAGTLTHPARQNLRPIPITVGGKKWHFQYSPYGYYNEHCIIFNQEHIPMKIDAAVFEKLFDITDTFPHYFVGSNADLPIVGGSILSHEHFQGGRYTFAMETAKPEKELDICISGVSASILKWPMSVIRLTGSDRKLLSVECDRILRAWRGYSDASVGIFAFTDDGVPHNTITPIARKKDDVYECDLVLRNNITSADRPLGIFHPNPSLHHIKKENIGLIEVMGLAVLPGRLAAEIPSMAAAILSKTPVAPDSPLSQHADWLNEIMTRRDDITDENAEAVIKQEIGRVFEQVLSDAGVYKRDETGAAAFMRFAAYVRDFS